MSGWSYSGEMGNPPALACKSRWSSFLRGMNEFLQPVKHSSIYRCWFHLTFPQLVLQIHPFLLISEDGGSRSVSARPLRCHMSAPLMTVPDRIWSFTLWRLVDFRRILSTAFLRRALACYEAAKYQVCLQKAGVGLALQEYGDEKGF